LACRSGNRRICICHFNHRQFGPGSCSARHSVRCPSCFGRHAPSSPLLQKRSAMSPFSQRMSYGIAFMMKQPGVYFGMLGIILLCGNPPAISPHYSRSATKRCLSYLAGMVLPYSTTCLVFIFTVRWTASCSGPIVCYFLCLASGDRPRRPSLHFKSEAYLPQ